MAHRKPPASSSRPTGGRGNRRTRGGAGRHNRKARDLTAAQARIRMCLCCGRPFRSAGPWNRICGRCQEQNVEVEDARIYHVPSEWRGSPSGDGDNF